MKKSVWSAYFIALSPEEMVLEFERAGYGYCELSFEHGAALLRRGPDPKKTGRAFAAFAKKHGICFTQGHLPLSYKICQNRDDLEKMKQWLDLFHGIGIQYCVLHCDKFLEASGMSDEERLERNLAALKELGAYIQGTNLVICLENLNVFPIDADILLKLLAGLDEKHFAICLDTGHLFMNNEDICTFIQKAGGRIKALHLADNEGAADQHMMPCGRGKIDFVPVFRALKKAQYDGLYNLEIPGENHAPLEILRLKLAYIDKMMDILDQLSDEVEAL